MHQHAGGGDADLAGIAVFVGRQQLAGHVHIGVAEDDGRGMAAEFHRDPLHVQPGHGGELLADGGGAGERDFFDGRVRDQVGADLSRDTVDEVDDAGWDAGIGEAAHQFGAAGRGFFRAFQDDRAAGGEGGGDFAHGLVDREVPRGEGGDDADRFFDDQLIHALGAGRDDTAIGAAGFLGEPVDHIGAGHGFTHRLEARLALFDGHQGGDAGGAFAQQVGGLAHDFAALVAVHLAPHREAFFGGFQGAVEIGALGMGNLAGRLAGGGVDHHQHLAGFRRDPVAVDEQVDVVIV